MGDAQVREKDCGEVTVTCQGLYCKCMDPTCPEPHNGDHDCPYAAGTLQARVAARERDLQKPLSDAIRHTVRTELGIPEGEGVSSDAFDIAASLVLRYLITRRVVYEARQERS